MTGLVPALGTPPVDDGDKLMRPIRTGISKARLLVVLAPLALAGCVPGAYVHDYPQDDYYYGSYGSYGSGGAYYRGPYSNYYGYPGYYGSSYYGSSYYYRPRVVYYDHDHDDRDCRHESHRDRRQYDDRDRYDRGRYRDERDTDRAGPTPHRLPPTGAAPLRRTPSVAPPQASGPPPKAARTSNPCAAGQRNCGSPGKAPEVRSEDKSDRNSRDYPGDRRR